MKLCLWWRFKAGSSESWNRRFYFIIQGWRFTFRHWSVKQTPFIWVSVSQSTEEKYWGDLMVLSTSVSSTSVSKDKDSAWHSTEQNMLKKIVPPYVKPLPWAGNALDIMAVHPGFPYGALRRIGKRQWKQRAGWRAGDGIATASVGSTWKCRLLADTEWSWKRSL